MDERRSVSDDALERALVDLGEHIVHPEVADLSTVVVARLREHDRPSRRRLLAIAAAAIVAVLAIVLAFPTPREAVADWLGIGPVGVVHTNEIPGDLGTKLQLGHAATIGDARKAAGHDVLAPKALGAPSGVFVGEPSASTVTLIWSPRPALPAVRDTGVGLLLTQIPGSVDRQLVEKLLGPGTTLQTVPVGHAIGYWIAGARHELFYFDANGEPRPDTTRLAANTLLW